MKRLLLLCFVVIQIQAKAQYALSYDDLLAFTTEIEFSDSLIFDTETGLSVPIDSFTIKKWFPQLLSTGTNKFKNKFYYLQGKITQNEHFDLLMLVEEKKRNDSTGIKITYLVSARKNGDYIASIKAAVNGTKKKTDYNISSSLYKGNKIVQDSRITINAQFYDDLTHYKINSGGRFIMYTD